MLLFSIGVFAGIVAAIVAALAANYATTGDLGCAPWSAYYLRNESSEVGDEPWNS